MIRKRTQTFHRTESEGTGQRKRPVLGQRDGVAAEGAVGRAEGGPLGGSHRKDPSSSAMEHHGEGLPDGLSWGPIPLPKPPAPRRAFVPRPQGAELDLLVPEEQQGWSLRTPRAPPTQRMQSRAPRAPEPLQSGGGTRGGERSGAQGTEAVGWVRAGIFCTRGTPAQGTAVPPSCLGISGATSKRPPSLAGVVSLILRP